MFILWCAVAPHTGPMRTTIATATTDQAPAEPSANWVRFPPKLEKRLDFFRVSSLFKFYSVLNRISLSNGASFFKFFKPQCPIRHDRKHCLDCPYADWRPSEVAATSVVGKNSIHQLIVLAGEWIDRHHAVDVHAVRRIFCQNMGNARTFGRRP